MSNFEKRPTFSRPEESSSLHQPFYPEEIRSNERISAEIIVQDKGTSSSYQMRVWRLSPLGLELCENSGVHLALEKGQSITVRLVIADQVSTFPGLIVDFVSRENDKKIWGIRLVPAEASQKSIGDRRRDQRWLCNEQFYPTGVAANPARYNDFIYFRAKDISSSGMQLVTSLRNKFIVPGMKFNCTMNFPLISRSNFDMRVKNVRIITENGKENLSVGIEFDESNKKLKEIIGQHLLQFGSVNSLAELHSSGLSVDSVTSAVDFKFVRTAEEYQKVLELRREAYVAANKVPADIDIEEMGDIYDSRARIVLGTYRGEAVATCRLIFTEHDDTLEHEEFVEWGTELPRKDQIIEISRTCTRSDFRGSDLLIAMFRFNAMAVIQSKREWIVISCTEELMGLYRKVGFKPSALKYDHPFLANSPHIILIGNIADAITGRGINPLYWNLVWSNVADYISDFEMKTLNEPLSSAKMRIALYSLLKPLTNYLKKRKLRRSDVERRTLTASSLQAVDKAG